MVACVAIMTLWAVPRSALEFAFGADALVLSALVVSGTAAALHGVLQAVVQCGTSRWRAFGPGSAVSLLAAIGAGLLGRGEMGAILALLFLYQSVPLAVLWWTNRQWLARLRESEQPDGSASAAHLGQTSVYGLINCVSILVVYICREYWLRHTSADVAEAVFFAWRLSDLCLGVVATILPGSRALERLRMLSAEGHSGKVILAAAGGLVALTLLLIGLAVAPLPLLLAAVLSQLLADVARLPSVATTIAEVQSGSPGRYAVVILAGPVIAAHVASILVGFNPMAAAYIFMSLAAAGQALGYFGFRRGRKILPLRSPRQQPPSKR
jgi:hypothetical protein